MPYILLGAPAHQKYAEELKNCGFTPISLPSDKRLNKIVNTHADTLIFTDGKVYIANREYIKSLPVEIAHNFTETDDFPYGEYPTDTKFNALVIGDKLFVKEKSISASVTDYAKKSGYTFVSVRQGYARCSTLALDNAAITADIGIGTSIAAQGIKVFIISSGHIALDGCKYGFIGGASFVDKTRKTVYFFGDISLHPDGREIVGFIKKNGYDVVCLSGTPTDYGGAVII